MSSRTKTHGQGSDGYRPGQRLVCRITESEPGGYKVLALDDNLSGFLPSTQENLRPGDEILARYLCVHNDRLLFSKVFEIRKSET